MNHDFSKQTIFALDDFFPTTPKDSPFTLPVQIFPERTFPTTGFPDFFWL